MNWTALRANSFICFHCKNNEERNKTKHLEKYFISGSNLYCNPRLSSIRIVSISCIVSLYVNIVLFCQCQQDD